MEGTSHRQEENLSTAEEKRTLRKKAECLGVLGLGVLDDSASGLAPVPVDPEPAPAILLPVPSYPAGARTRRALIPPTDPDVRAPVVAVVPRDPHVSGPRRHENGLGSKWRRSRAHVEASARPRAGAGGE